MIENHRLSTFSVPPQGAHSFLIIQQPRVNYLFLAVSQNIPLDSFWPWILAASLSHGCAVDDMLKFLIKKHPR